jgi:hypothetical protein
MKSNFCKKKNIWKKYKKIKKYILKNIKTEKMNSSTSSASLALADLQATLKVFELYSSIFVLIPSLILSSFTLVVFTRKRFWHNTTMGFYYSTSTLMSIFAIIVGLLVFFPPAFGYDLHFQSDNVCKLLWILRPQAIFGAGYFQILITLDRTLNSIYYNRFPFLKKIKNLVLITLAIEVAVAVGNAIEWFRFRKYTPVVVANNGANSTQTTYTVSCTLTTDMLTAYNFEAIFSRVIPSVVNLCLNLIIIRVLLKSRRNVANHDRSKGNSGGGGGGGLSVKDKQFTYSLIAQNFIFTVVTMPHVVLSGMQIREQFNEPGSPNALLVNVMFSFGVWCSHAFEALPFLMNLGFNKMFRAELEDMCLSIIGKRRTTNTSITAGSLNNGSTNVAGNRRNNQPILANQTI